MLSSATVAPVASSALSSCSSCGANASSDTSERMSLTPGQSVIEPRSSVERHRQLLRQHVAQRRAVDAEVDELRAARQAGLHARDPAIAARLRHADADRVGRAERDVDQRPRRGGPLTRAPPDAARRQRDDKHDNEGRARTTLVGHRPGRDRSRRKMPAAADLGSLGPSQGGIRTLLVSTGSKQAIAAVRRRGPQAILRAQVAQRRPA